MTQDPFIRHLISKHKQPAFIDSVGSGSLFGEIVACAVMIPEPFFNAEVDDSKKLKHKDIYRLAPELKKNLIFSLGIATVDEIKRFRSTFLADKLAMLRAVQGLPKQPDALFIDGDKKYTLRVCPTEYTVVKGDAKIFGISCSSIIAKDYRDHMVMDEYGEKYSQYHIRNNKGYRSPAHLRAIRAWGVTKLHREYMPQIQQILQRG